VGVTTKTPAAGPLRPPDPVHAASADELIRELHRSHALTLIRTAKLLLRDQAAAEDAVQDAFLGLYRALPRLSDHDKLLPYLRTAVINRCRSELRGRRRAAARAVQHEPPASSAEDAAMAGQERHAVLDAVGRLPRRAREVLVLRYYLGLSDDQIAVTLGVSRGTVSSTASRALGVLATTLKEEL
jgi:RNA polymerase sigma-70 factor (sigma-E family)